MSAFARPKVLVQAAGPLGEHLAGPEIRALELARALRERFEVTLAGQCDEGEREGMRVIPSTRRRMLGEATRSDAVLSACLPPYLLALRPARRLLAISDQYDPLEHELTTLSGEGGRDRELRAQLAIKSIQLSHADLVLCASERQRTELRTLATQLPGGGREGLDPVVIPFGIPDPPARGERRPLRERFSQIAAGDTVVLWWGSIWRWLDAETAIRAFAALAGSRPDIKLVLTAGLPPGRALEERFHATEEMRALAAELGVLGRTVLFLEDWIPYERRHEYLHDADLGLTLHRDAEEARLAARTRYMDYLSSGLPALLGRGDELAEEFADAGFAWLLERPTPEQLATRLAQLASSPEELAAARAAGAQLAANHRVGAVAEKLRETVSAALDAPSTAPGHTPALMRSTVAYYARQLTDRLAA